MSEPNSGKTAENPKLETRVKQSAAELALLLRRAPRQNCRAEAGWNESDDFIDRFNDIWGEQVG
jgi:hypothetical protein